MYVLCLELSPDQLDLYVTPAKDAVNFHVRALGVSRCYARHGDPNFIRSPTESPVSSRLLSVTFWHETDIFRIRGGRSVRDQVPFFQSIPCPTYQRSANCSTFVPPRTPHDLLTHWYRVNLEGYINTPSSHNIQEKQLAISLVLCMPIQ